MVPICLRPPSNLFFEFIYLLLMFFIFIFLFQRHSVKVDAPRTRTEVLTLCQTAPTAATQPTVCDS